VNRTCSPNGCRCEVYDPGLISVRDVASIMGPGSRSLAALGRDDEYGRAKTIRIGPVTRVC